MATVYSLFRNLRFEGEVVATRPICGAYIVPTALLLKQAAPLLGTPGRFRLYFCAAREPGVYEWLSHCDDTHSFVTEAEAREFARTWN